MLSAVAEDVGPQGDDALRVGFSKPPDFECLLPWLVLLFSKLHRLLVVHSNLDDLSNSRLPLWRHSTPHPANLELL